MNKVSSEWISKGIIELRPNEEVFENMSRLINK